MLPLLKKLKLKHQLMMLIILSVFMLALLQAFYYARFYYHSQEQSEASTENILNQVEGSLSGMAFDIKKASEAVSYNRYIQDFMIATNNEDRRVYFNFANEVSTYIRASNKSIYDILMVDLEGRIISSSYNDTSAIIQTLDSTYHFSESKLIKPEFSNLVTDVLGHNYYAFVNTFPLVGISSVQKAGTSILLCNIDYMQSLVDKVTLPPNSLLFITDKEKKVVASNKKEMVGKTADPDILQAFGNVDKKVLKKYKEHNSILQRKSVELMNWEVVSVIPVSEITKNLQSTISLGMLISAVMLVLLTMVGILFGWNITRPISKLIRFMNSVGDKNLNRRIENIENNEVGQLAVHINNMLEEIQDMTRKIVSTQSSLYEMELSKKQAELSALQSQINPHFLYNTLDCIRSIAYAYNAQEIATISTSMSKIFRYSIKGGDIVLVKDELECIKDYLEIMSIRYPDKFSIRMEVEEQLFEMKITKFILQPIIENAIYHGLERKKGSGLLRIKGCITAKGNLYFEIHDNGKGISREDMQKIEVLLDGNTSNLSQDGKGSIGLINIHNRIKHVYGPDFGIKLFSRENEGTTVMVELPPMP